MKRPMDEVDRDLDTDLIDAYIDLLEAMAKRFWWCLING